MSSLDSTSLAVINQDTSTKMPTKDQNTSQNLTFTEAHLGIYVNWQPLSSLNFNHLPKIVNLGAWFTEARKYCPSWYTYS